MEYQIVITIFSDKKNPEIEDLNVCVDAPAITDLSDKVEFFGRRLAEEIASDIPNIKAKWVKVSNDVKQTIVDYESITGKKL